MSKLGMPKAELLKFLETNTEIAFLEIEYDKKTYRCFNTMKEFVGWVYFDNGIMTAAYVFEEYSDQPASKTDFALLVCVNTLELTFPTKIASHCLTNAELNWWRKFFR